MTDLHSSTIRPADLGRYEVEAFRTELRGLLAEVPRELSCTVVGQVRLALTMADEAVKLMECQAGPERAKEVLRQALQY